jgi:phosphoribosylformimino-5-aminoimidazole carboxamide ribotide isomerase
VAVLIPSIDLMGGKIVQLVQGEKKAREFDDFDYWIERFSPYPTVQLIDLDAAMQQGDNRELVARTAARLPCQVGGGIRSVEAAQGMLSAGARRVIIGSALVREGRVNTPFATELAGAVGAEKLVFALDSRGGKVAIEGWRTTTELTPFQIIEALEPFCGGFLYTHIDTEGLMQGFPRDVVHRLRAATSKNLAVAGGISTLAEIQELDTLGVNAVVGMAIYTDRLHAPASRPG